MKKKKIKYSIFTIQIFSTFPYINKLYLVLAIRYFIHFFFFLLC